MCLEMDLNLGRRGYEVQAPPLELSFRMKIEKNY